MEALCYDNWFEIFQFNGEERIVNIFFWLNKYTNNIINNIDYINIDSVIYNEDEDVCNQYIYTIKKGKPDHIIINSLWKSNIKRYGYMIKYANSIDINVDMKYIHTMNFLFTNRIYGYKMKLSSFMVSYIMNQNHYSSRKYEILINYRLDTGELNLENLKSFVKYYRLLCLNNSVRNDKYIYQLIPMKVIKTIIRKKLRVKGFNYPKSVGAYTISIIEDFKHVNMIYTLSE